MTTNYYRPLIRPASMVTLPAGLQWQFVEAPHDLAHRRTDLPRCDTPHGVIATDRRLTPDECETYSLRPVAR